MKYIYIINGRADKAPQYGEFFAQLKEVPHTYEVYTTLGEGDATRYVRLYCDLHPDEEVCFVACGGNGIINGVASGLMGYLEYNSEFKIQNSPWPSSTSPEPPRTSSSTSPAAISAA